VTKRILRRIATIELAGARVPSIMLLPELDTRVSAVLLLHGYSSSKEVLSNTMGRALAVRGIASLAIDLPLHGTRDEEMFEDAHSSWHQRSHDSARAGSSVVRRRIGAEDVEVV